MFCASSLCNKFAKQNKIGHDQTRISQICHGKWLADAGFWEIWTGSDTIRVSQIRHGKWLILDFL